MEKFLAATRLVGVLPGKQLPLEWWNGIDGI